MGGFAGFGVEDIFENFFGGMRTAQRGPQRGADLRYDMVISFEEAVFGCEKEIEVARWETCPTCSRHRRRAGHQPGALPGVPRLGRGAPRPADHLRPLRQRHALRPLRRQGHRGHQPLHQLQAARARPGPPAGCRSRSRPAWTRAPRCAWPARARWASWAARAGNLFVVLQVRRHKIFRREHNDILLDLNINVAQAALGDEVEVPTVDGPGRITIPAGTQHGDTIVIKGKGVPHLQSTRRGDQVVRLAVATPTRLTDEQRRLFQELAKSLGSEVTPQEEKGFFEKVKDAFGV